MTVVIPHPNIAGACKPSRWADLLRYAFSNFIEIFLDQKVVVDEEDMHCLLDHTQVWDVKSQAIELMGVRVQIIPFGHMNGVLVLPSWFTR